MAANFFSGFPTNLLQHELDLNDTITVADNSSIGDGSEFEDDNDDHDNVLRPCVQSLGLSTSYVPGWEALHAFRELYQNWYIPNFEHNASLC